MMSDSEAARLLGSQTGDGNSAEHHIRIAFCPREAAAALGISERKFAELLADRDSGLPVARIGRRVVIPIDGLRAWLADRSKVRQP